MTTDTSSATILKKMMLAGCSNMSAACVTNPIDVVKVRMQLEGELSTTRVGLYNRTYAGFLSGSRHIHKTEGVRGLYKGLSASLLREASYSSIRLGLYDPMKSLFVTETERKDQKQLPLVKKILAGGCTGALGSAIANPTDLIKIRMQSDLTGKRYSNVFNAFLCILRNEGGVLRGLYTGVGATTQRAALLTATQIPSYDHSKHFILDKGWMFEGMPLHIVCSMFAGLMTATVTSPVDVIKTRIMNERTKSYSGTIDAASKIIKTEGIHGLFKGWFPNWMRIGPHTIVALMMFEQLRALTGMSPV